MLLDFKDNADFKRESFNLTVYRISAPADGLIGAISQIEEVKGNYVIVDGQQNMVFITDSGNNRTRNLGNRGRGPGEYLIPQSFSYDTLSDEVRVVDAGAEKIVSFSAVDFHYKGESPAGSIASIEYLGDGKSVVATAGAQGERYDFILYEGKEATYLLPSINSSGYVTSPNKPLFRLNGELYFYRQFDDAVYRIEDGKAIAAFRLKLGDEKFADADFLVKAGRDNGFFSRLENSEYISYHEICSAGNSLCVSYIVGNEQFIALYDFEKGLSYLTSKREFEELLGIPGLTYIAGTIDGCYVMPLFDYENGEIGNETISKYLRENSPKENETILIGFKYKS